MDGPWISFGIAFHREQVSAILDDQVRRAAEFDVFVGRIRAGRVEQDFVDPQVGTYGRNGSQDQAQPESERSGLVPTGAAGRGGQQTEWCRASHLDNGEEVTPETS